MNGKQEKKRLEIEHRLLTLLVRVHIAPLSASLRHELMDQLVVCYALWCEAQELDNGLIVEDKLGKMAALLDRVDADQGN